MRMLAIERRQMWTSAAHRMVHGIRTASGAAPILADFQVWAGGDGDDGTAAKSKFDKTNPIPGNAMPSMLVRRIFHIFLPSPSGRGPG